MPINPNHRVSVIIPTYNAGPDFEGLLRRLQSQSRPPEEIIVIDSSSTDGTAETALQAGARVIRIPKAQFDHGGTRNHAAQQATGETLVFMTQDACPADAYLIERLLMPYMPMRAPLARTRGSWPEQMPTCLKKWRGRAIILRFPCERGKRIYPSSALKPFSVRTFARLTGKSIFFERGNSMRLFCSTKIFLRGAMHLERLHREL